MDDEYLVGANLSSEGGAELSAEFVLRRESRFRVQAALDGMRVRARRYQLDAGRLGAALLADIDRLARAGTEESGASSERSSFDPRTALTAAQQLGKPREFDHDLVRLIGLWQLAAGCRVDGDFGDASSKKLVGKPLADATELRVSDH